MSLIHCRPLPKTQSRKLVILGVELADMVSPMEEKRYNVLPKNRQNDFLLKTWTKKESIYKMTDGAHYTFPSFSVDDYLTKTKIVLIDGINYVISIAGKGKPIYYHIDNAIIF